MTLAYSKGFKYQVREVPVTLFVGDVGQTENIRWKWLTLSLDGYLTINNGYAWDGCSGPTIDSSSTMKAGLGHDAGYQLIRQGFLPASAKAKFDKFLYNQMLIDGAFKIRAKYYYAAVSKFGRSATLASHRQRILYAP